MAGNGTRSRRGTPLALAVFLLLRLLLPADAGATSRSWEASSPAAVDTAANHAAHAAAGHDTSQDRDGHHADSQGCHFCRFDTASFLPPTAPALELRPVPASAVRPAGPPPRLRNLSIRVRARAPPAPA